MAPRTSVVLALFVTLSTHAGRTGAQILQKPVITVFVSQATVPENPNAITRTGNTSSLSTTATAATFTFRIDQTLPVDFPIAYAVSGSAAPGKDYQALPGVVTIGAGRTTATVTVSPIDDSEDETDETVVVAVSVTSRSAYTAGRPASASLAIVDDDDVRIIGASFAPDTVLGGRVRDLRITLSGAAPAGGLAVRVQSGNAAVVGDGRALVAAGTRVGVATLSTTAVSSTVTVPLTVVEPNGSSASTSLVVLTEPAVSRMNFRRSDTFGGGTISGSVAIDAPAPPDGLRLPVSLAVQSPVGTALPASAPATLTIPAGSSGATLSISTQPVTATTQVLVTVGSGSRAGVTTVGIHPVPVIQSISATPDPVGSSDSVNVTVRLVDPAPSLFGGWSVYLSGSGPVQMPTDTRLPIAGGAQEATIRLGTNSVASNTVATVGVADAAGKPAIAEARFTVEPPRLSTLYFRGQSFWGGQSNSGLVSLGRTPAPPSGFTVPITMSVLGGSGGAVPGSGPATVTIPAGQASIGFSITTDPVTTRTLLLVTAGTGSGAVADTLELHPRPTVQTVDVTPDPSVGDSVDVRVRLNVANGGSQYYTLFVTGTGPVQIPSLNRIVFVPGVQENSLRIGVDPVPNSTQATINISEPGTQPGPWNAAFIVSPTAPRNLYFRGQAIWGGQSNSGAVSIDRDAPAGGFLVPITLSVAGSPGGSVPASAPPAVSIPAGQKSIGFSITTQPVTTRTLLIVTGTTEVGAVADTVELHPRPTVQSVQVTPAPAFGGDSLDVRVRLDVPNGASQNYTLFVTGTGPLRIPSTNRISFTRGGPQENSLRIGTDPVSGAVPATITIAETGTQPGVWNAAFTVLPKPPLPEISTVAFNSATAVGGTAVPVTIVLSGPVPAGQTLQVNLSATDPVQSPVPSVLVIPAGQAFGTVTVQTRVVAQATQGTLRAETATGSAVSGTVTVQPPPVNLGTLTLSPPRLVGGTPATATIALTGPAPPGGFAVALATDNPSAAVPPTVTVPAGATAASFPVTTNIVTAPIGVRITASNGAQQVVRVLNVDAPPPPSIVAFAASPGNAIGGGEIELTMSLSRPADPGGFTATLSSTDPGVVPAATLRVNAGQQTGTVTVRSAAVPTQRSVRVGAPGGPFADIPLRPVPVDRIQTPGSARAGETVDVDVRLLEPAPAGGLRVPLSSSNPAIASVPAFVDVPAGATSATLQIQTASGATGPVTLTAGLGPSAGSRDFRVR